MSGETSVSSDALLRREVSDRRTVQRVTPTGSCGGEIGAISHQVVYDALVALTDKGLLRRIQPPGSPAHHGYRVGDDHTTSSAEPGRLDNVGFAVGDTLCVTAADTMGHEDDEPKSSTGRRCPLCVAAA